MGRYVSIKGWLACEYEQVSVVKQEIEKVAKRASEYTLDNEIAERYLSAWQFPTSPLNWTSYIFFGADVRSRALNFIQEQIRSGISVAQEIEGEFFVDQE